MNIKELFIGFITVFVVTLGVAAIVSYLWSLIAHGAGVFDWETSLNEISNLNFENIKSLRGEI